MVIFVKNNIQRFTKTPSVHLFKKIERRMEMKVIVAGGRDFNDYELLKSSLLRIFSNKDLNTIEIVSGAARGADSLGERFAEEFGLTVHRFPADWNGPLKRGAGLARNKEMAEFSDALVAFHDGVSTGTAHMIKTAKKKDMPLRVIRY
jgi:hypothetical protein